MYLYILTNKPAGTLYIGVTDNLVGRIFEHRNHMVAGFTNRYNLTRLVHFERYEMHGLAVQRKKSLSRWVRAWKIALIEQDNPNWRDLWVEILDQGTHGKVP